jgi:translation elongation factor EF-Tu-like GTPase
MGLFDKKPKSDNLALEGGASASFTGRGALVVSDVFFLSGKGTIVYGRVVSGVLEKNLSAEVGGNKALVRRIEKESGEVPFCSEGDIVALCLGDARKEWFHPDQLLVFK